MFLEKCFLGFRRKSDCFFGLLYAFFLLSFFPVNFLKSEAGAVFDSGTDTNALSAQPYLGGWRLEPVAQAKSGHSSMSLIVVKPGGLVSRFLGEGDEGSVVQQGGWTLSTAPVQELLVDGVLVVRWGDEDYSFIYSVGSDVYLRSSKQASLSREEWDDLPVYLLKSEKNTLGSWTSRRSGDAAFEGSVLSKSFIGLWGFADDSIFSKERDVLQILLEKGSALFYTELGVSQGFWFLEKNQIRISWVSGERLGREDILRSGDGEFEFLCRSNSEPKAASEEVAAVKLVRLESPVGLSRIEYIKNHLGLKKGASVKRGRKPQLAEDQVIAPGLYAVTALGSQSPEVYFDIGTKGDIALVQLRNSGSPSNSSAEEGAPRDRVGLGSSTRQAEPHSIERNGKASYQVILKSTVLEWATGFKEVIYPSKSGVYTMDSFRPGSFLDESPVATFTLAPVSSEVLVEKTSVPEKR